MPLDPKQLQNFKEWISQKKVTLACSMCGGTEFQIGEVVCAPAYQPAAGLAIGGDQVPMLQVICSGCCHVSFFAALPWDRHATVTDAYPPATRSA
jgi:hypothetical protein